MTEVDGTSERELRSTAFHEAGHVAAHYFLRVPFNYVTIVESDDAVGHVHHGPVPDAWIQRIEAATYSGFGGFVDAPTRRWAEARVMVSLAGGLAAQQAMGLSETEVGSGLVEVSDSVASALAAKHGGEPDDWTTTIAGGDIESALTLVEQLTGGNLAEAEPYLDWLSQRTVTLLAHPYVWLAVETVAGALMERHTLSAREARRVIRAALDAEFERFKARTYVFKTAEA